MAKATHPRAAVDIAATPPARPRAGLRAEPGPAGRTYTLHPGDVQLGHRGDRLVTLLGSCVAVVLTDRNRTTATMCHIVHSQWGDNLPAEATVNAGPAFRRMFGLLVGAGIDPLHCDAYIYGGGDMFPNLKRDRVVGDTNVADVQAMLDQLQIRMMAVDVGGPVYRGLSWTIGHDDPTVTAVEI